MSESQSLPLQGEPLSPGRCLAQSRAEKGLSVADVAQRLKYAERQILALEADDFARLPDHTFIRGMARGYARLLGIAAEPLIAELDRRHQTPASTVEATVKPIPFPDGRRRSARHYVLLSAFAAFVAIAVGFELLPDMTSIQAPPAMDPPPSLPAASAPPSTVPIQSAESAAPTMDVSTGNSVAIPEPPAAGEVRTQSAMRTGATRLISLRFDKDAWVEIRQSDGKTLLSQLNPAGTRQVVEGIPPFALTIGNAPSVHVTYNEQPVDLRPHYKVDVARLTLN